MTDMTTTTTPRTYAAAAKVAENVTTDELAALLAEDDNPDVFLGARRPRRIAMRARVHRSANRTLAGVGRAFLSFEYCSRAGYTQSGSAFPRPERLAEFAPILAFRNGRVVRWIRGEA